MAILSYESRKPSVPRFNLFDKICAILAVVLGVVLLLLGMLGLVTGCSANFSLPPVLGIFPALVGWGIVRSVRFAFRASRAMRETEIPASATPSLSLYRDPIPPSAADIDADIDRQQGSTGSTDTP